MERKVREAKKSKKKVPLKRRKGLLPGKKVAE